MTDGISPAPADGAAKPSLPAGFRWPADFLMGASTSAHQTEGNNVSSDWWGLERLAGSGALGGHLREPSGDAVDSFHRWPEDMDLLRGLGFNAYRFSVEWARVEPEEGLVSRAAIAHYRAMVRGAVERGLTPVVTLHHFANPHWFAARGGWTADGAVELFVRYVETAVEILGDDVEYVATINEPNMLALTAAFLSQSLETLTEINVASVAPDAETSQALIRAHHAAAKALKAANPRYKVGWTVANQVYQAEPGAEAVAAAIAHPREDVFLEAAREDDWIGVQAYTRTRIGPDGPLPAPDDAERTLTGWEFYPEAVGHAVRHTVDVVGPDVPVLVTENGIATADDEQRIAYTSGALSALAEAVHDGADVRGYLHWTALDNYEWGSYIPTFGLIAVDRTTFARTPKPSAHWLGTLARDIAGDPAARD
ncbi:family 1 glycosylhydrolase [Yinghuangia seranimata]|uniref:family 1 glycosylhydrolase n=1 Tax=Yinghuangia seranimata TaxID=408067 RepID=UPI00248B9A44|nr:family 1 glycosylhydrolase [Yinghuangia seranimata]MDI2124673.1 family 1 glycosylhydrolase [Yinghuangia seranimata]